MLNIFADALLIAARMNPELRRHDRREEHRQDIQEQLPSLRYVFPKHGL